MATKTEEISQKILSALDSNKETIHSYTFAQETGEDHQLVIGAIKSLQCLGNVSYSPIVLTMLLGPGQNYNATSHFTYIIILFVD